MGICLMHPEHDVVDELLQIGDRVRLRTNREVGRVIEIRTRADGRPEFDARMDGWIAARLVESEVFRITGRERQP